MRPPLRYTAPKEYLPEELLAPQSRPKRLRPGAFGWIPQLLRADGEEVIRTAGIDAWCFVRVCHLAIALFLFVSLWCGATCLVANLLGGAVAPLIAEKANPTRSEYTYWVPPPPTTKEEEKKASKEKSVKTPRFYVPDEDLPKPPAGLEWKQYAADVPPLVPAEAVEYLRNGTANGVKAYSDEEIARFVLLRDEAAAVTTVPLTDIDKATMANVRDRSPTLWVHAASVWAVTAATLWLLRKFSREAVALRLRYLTSTPPGAETHSILVTDIPGIETGTLTSKLDKTVLKALPEGSRKGVRNLLTGEGSGSGSGSRSAAKSAAAAASAAAVDPLDASSAPAPANPFMSPHGLETDPWGKASAFLAAGNDTQALVEKEFGELYPGEVAHVQSVHETSAIDPLLAEYEKLKLAAQDNLDDYVAQARRAVEGATAAKEKKAKRKVKSSSAASSAAGTPNKAFSPAPGEAAAAGEVDAAALSAALAAIKRRTRTVRGALIGEWGRKTYSLGAKESTKIDAVQFCIDRMGFLEERIKEEQVKAKAKASPSAFVTFKSRRTQALATQALEHHDTTVWHVHGAPRPGGVLWPSLGYRAWERTIRFWGVWVAFVALMLLFLIPVAAIQKWVGAVGDVIPKAGPFKLVSGLVGGMLPPLVLVIFIALMPPILRVMGKIQGARSVSELDRGVITKFFIFQVVRLRFFFFEGRVFFFFFSRVEFFFLPRFEKKTENKETKKKLAHSLSLSLSLSLSSPPPLFLPSPPPTPHQKKKTKQLQTRTHPTPQQATIFFGSFVAGSLFDTAALWAKDPAAGVRALGLSAPTMSSFFLNYVAIKALFAPAFKNLRLIPFIIFAIRSKLSATERSKARLWSEQYQIYGVEVPQLTMVLLLGLVFCGINPLIPPTCLLYFVVVLFFQKYRVMYVARPSYQTGGAIRLSSFSPSSLSSSSLFSCFLSCFFPSLSFSLSLSLFFFSFAHLSIRFFLSFLRFLP